VEFGNGAGPLGDQIKNLKADRVRESLADAGPPFIEFLFQLAVAVALLHLRLLDAGYSIALIPPVYDSP
jgi:hypothetical protein